MKKVFLLLISFISMSLLLSCNKNNETEHLKMLKSEAFEFSKEMVLSDAEGNAVTLLIQAHTQSALDAHTSDVLSLNVFTKDFSKIPARANNAVQIDDDFDDDFDQSHDVLLKVLDYKFSESITGFNVASSLDANRFGDETSPRSWTEYHYIFGSPFNIVGAIVDYTSESRSKEYMKVKLSKKTSSDNLFFQQLAKQKLYSPGDYFWYQGTTVWEEYRLKIRIKRNRGSGHGHTWAWLI